MTENSIRVFQFLQQHPDKEFTKREIVDALDDIQISAVTGSINGLVKKGYVEERKEVLPPLYKGDKPLEIRYAKITKEGLAFDPYEEEKRMAQIRAEERARKKQERALAKLERAKQNFVS